MTSTTLRISPAHEKTLKESAISFDEAKAWGVTSVTDASGLQGTDLDYPTNRGRTGILFPLRMLNGLITYQLRLDEPDLDDHGKPTRKYLQASGTGSIINIPAPMQDRVNGTADTERANRVLIVEGTKQTIAATLHAPEDLLVVGIQGCRNWSSEGVPVPELSTLLTGREQVTVCLDADWHTNLNVWSAADSLVKLARSFGVKDVRMADLPVGGKAGLDDYLAMNPDTEGRKNMLATLIDIADGKLGRKPAAKKASASVKLDEKISVDLDRGQIVKRSTSPDGMTHDEVVLQAAAQILESEAHVDEETGDASSQRLTLEVTVPTDDGAASKYKVKVASKDLANIGDWLDRLPHGIGVPIPRKSKPDDDVANAIRAVNTDITSITVVNHVGWTFDAEDDVWRWCDGSGAFGPEDKVTRLRGEPASRDFQAIDLPDIVGVDRTLIRKHARNFVMARELFRPDKKFSWDVAVAAWGLSFLGITPNAALCYFGPPSSGKSTIAQALASSLSASWAPRSGSAMATFNARPAGMDLMPNGLSNCFLHVDDLRPESDKRSMDMALKAFDALLRRAHGSGGAVRGEVNRSQDSLGVRKVDSSAPMMIITGEQIPSGDGFAESALDRALFIEVQPNTQFTDEDLPKFENLAKSGDFRYATASFLTWIANNIMGDGHLSTKEARESFDGWRGHLESTRQQRAADTIDPERSIFPADMKVSSRARLLAASLMIGRESVLQWAVEIKAITPDEQVALLADFEVGLVSAIKTHTREVMGGNASEAEIALTALRNAISSRQVSIDPAEESHKPLIGQLIKFGDASGPTLAVNHAAAAAALRWTGGPRALQRALAEVSLVGSDGKSTRTAKVGGQRVQVCAINPLDWFGGAAEAAEEATVDTAF
ncbi:hypothetical protein V5R04_07270 [Jonesiaceae bacterium BS-20]|uniref:DUF3854 domain-containing protein n=1 Tax=Jonesiaceae bacterium BS-20 TaxID=3120821 RepID=A0AAU7DZ31_9MICO